VDDASLYKHIDSELPDPDRAQQLIMPCASRAPLPTSHAGNGPSEKGVKLLQEMRDNVLLLLAERKLDLRHGDRSTQLGRKRERGLTTEWTEC